MVGTDPGTNDGHTISVTVTNDDGGSDTVAVYHPDAGFVTGGGFFDSFRLDCTDIQPTATAFERLVATPLQDDVALTDACGEVTFGQ